jgi:mRNA interferase MazF
MVKRGEIWWADLPEPAASEPGYRRPVVVIQSDGFNRSQIGTVVVVALSSNRRLAAAPGNLTLLKAKTGLSKDSVANVSQIVTVDKASLSEKAGQLNNRTMQQLSEAIKLVLEL